MKIKLSELEWPKKSSADTIAFCNSPQRHNYRWRTLSIRGGYIKSMLYSDVQRYACQFYRYARLHIIIGTTSPLAQEQDIHNSYDCSKSSWAACLKSIYEIAPSLEYFKCNTQMQIALLLLTTCYA